jgi:hypothetical protein
VNPRHRYNMWYTQTVVCVPHYVKETRKKRTRDRDRPIASRTLDRARGRDERQRTDDVERRGGASGRDGDGGGGARETTRRRGGLEGDARERGGKTGRGDRRRSLTRERGGIGRRGFERGRRARWER